MDVASETARAYQAFAAGRNAEAADRANRILECQPEDPAALTLIGRLALVSGEPDVAHHLARRVLDKSPHVSALWLDLARALGELGRPEEAADAAQRAIDIDPTDPAAWISLGEIRLSLNDRERAADAFRKALTQEPGSAGALQGLCLADEVGPDSPIAVRTEELTRSPKLRPRELASLHYALAQICRRAGCRERFIHHLFAANSTQRSICPEGRADYAAIFDRLESAFTKDAFAGIERADPIEPTPIFILGMPRSGTTLLERLLAGHPAVAAGGELDYMRRPLSRAFERQTACPFPDKFETVARPELNAMARKYANRLSLIGKGSPHVTDKTPGNFHVLGLLRVLFPHGRIVHVARDPMDTCFSILQYPFSDRSPHTCDVELLAYVYARYRRLMNRWVELFADEFLTVEYELLVESPAAEASRVFGHCGLEWNDAYLEFHGGAGAVRTFSASQVRRPIYQSSVGAWREFADHLAPLRNALDSELERAGLGRRFGPAP